MSSAFLSMVCYSTVNLSIQPDYLFVQTVGNGPRDQLTRYDGIKKMGTFLHKQSYMYRIQVIEDFDSNT